ncbi:MAG: UDP-3-O-[3-hydroxymyristoyl] glucosamine N-acyltransferase [Chitinophagales bacterium]|jgi:UDP-3-O-[3-hydroxymyristoyl] glucosamine N-acyltransferase
MRITAQELAILLDAKIEGNPQAVVDKLVKIEEADADSLCFIANPKYEHFAETTHAGILVVAEDLKLQNKNGTTFLRVKDPYSSFALLLDKFADQEATKQIGIEQPSVVHESAQVHPSAYIGAFTYIGENVEIGEGVKVYPNSFIGNNVKIGAHSTISAGTKIHNHCKIGNRCFIHSGVVIGSDGFGFAPQKDGSFAKVPQTGNVVVGDDVEIGANTVIDRATLGSTTIKNGAKLDNLVQIAHNVVIGEHSVIAAQAGVSGSTKLGKHVMIGGQAGFVGHITIADGVKVNAQSGVSKSVDSPGVSISGSPAEPFRQHYKNIAYTRQIGDLMARIEKLEKALINKDS